MPSPESLLVAPGIDNGFGPIDPDIGVKDIALLHLSVKPAKILPFGAAVLRWEVEAPPTVQISINDGTAIGVEGRPADLLDHLSSPRQARTTGERAWAR